MNIKITQAPNPLASAFSDTLATTEAQIEYRKLIVVEELLQFMKRHGISRIELAKRMGVGPSRITAMLHGTSNLTIDTLVRAGRAVGADLVQTFVPEGQQGHWIPAHKVGSGDTACVAIDFAPREIAHARTPKMSQKAPANHDAEDAA